MVRARELTISRENRARVAMVLLAAALFALAGCSQSDSPVEEQEQEAGVEDVGPEEVRVPADVPGYTLTKDETVSDPATGLRLRGVAANTDATAEEDLEAVTRELWADSGGADAMQVLFYPNEPMADTTGTGMAFADEEAARATISSMYAASANADVEGQVEEAMGNDGIYVIATEQMIDEMIAEECAKWDTTTLGTPPPEWDCPGY